MTASHGPAVASAARSPACVRSPRSTWTPATSVPDRPRLKVETSHPWLRAARAIGMTDEPGTAQDQQAQAIMSRSGQARGVVASGRPAANARSRPGTVPGHDRRRPPDVSASHSHVRCGHLPAHPVRANRRNTNPEVARNIRGCPPLSRRVWGRLLRRHTSIVEGLRSKVQNTALAWPSSTSRRTPHDTPTTTKRSSSGLALARSFVTGTALKCSRTNASWPSSSPSALHGRLLKRSLP